MFFNRTQTGATVYMGESADTGGYQFRGSGDVYFQGNVGIGTTSPGTNKLKVAGDTEVTGNLTIGYQIIEASCTNTFTCKATCPVGTNVIGGGCLSSMSSIPPYGSVPVASTGEFWCYYSSGVTSYAYAVCARVQ